MPAISKPGRHLATAKQCEFGTSPGTGTEYVFIGFETEEAEHIGAYLYLSEKAVESSLLTLRDAFGWNGNTDTMAEQVIGKKASLVVEEEETQDGRGTRLRVKWINSPDTVKPMDKARLASLSSFAAKVFAEADKAKAAKAAKAAAPAATPATATTPTKSAW